MQYEENKALESYELVILRRSPFFTASLEGWATSARDPSFEAPRKRAAPQDDGGMKQKGLRSQPEPPV
jgi:hypothetical protein